MPRVWHDYCTEALCRVRPAGVEVDGGTSRAARARHLRDDGVRDLDLGGQAQGDLEDRPGLEDGRVDDAVRGLDAAELQDGRARGVEHLVDERLVRDARLEDLVGALG